MGHMWAHIWLWFFRLQLDHRVRLSMKMWQAWSRPVNTTDEVLLTASRTWVWPPITAHELLHAFLQLLLTSPLHHHLRVGDGPGEAGLRHVLVDLCCQSVFSGRQRWSEVKRDDERQKTRTKKEEVEASCDYPSTRTKRILKETMMNVWVRSLPVLPAECLLISIRDSGKLLFSLLFLLLLLLGQSSFEILNNSILLLLWSITLALLVKKQSFLESFLFFLERCD